MASMFAGDVEFPFVERELSLIHVGNCSVDRLEQVG